MGVSRSHKEATDLPESLLTLLLGVRFLDEAYGEGEVSGILKSVERPRCDVAPFLLRSLCLHRRQGCSVSHARATGASQQQGRSPGPPSFPAILRKEINVAFPDVQEASSPQTVPSICTCLFIVSLRGNIREHFHLISMFSAATPEAVSVLP